jgi:hypothetical protein
VFISFTPFYIFSPSLKYYRSISYKGINGVHWEYKRKVLGTTTEENGSINGVHWEYKRNELGNA